MRITQLNLEILQAQARLNLALFEYFTAGSGNYRPIEGTEELNDSNRQVILAMHAVYGGVYLGSFSDAEPLALYEGQEITNFSCDFCVPCYSGELERLIRDWRENGNSKSLDNAMKLVEQLQGKILCWS